MKEELKWHVFSLYQDVPTGVYEGLLFVFCLGVVIISCYGLRHGWRKIVGLLLAEYVFVIYCSTLIFRTEADGNGHNFKPFWSYDAIEDGRSELLAENLLNAVAFLPIGLFLGLVTQKAQNNYRTRIRRIALIIGIGLIISVSIETLQYFFHRGFAETDDVMHNTVGCLIGYFLVKGASFLFRRE